MTCFDELFELCRFDFVLDLFYSVCFSYVYVATSKASFLPLCYDVQRRLQLLKHSKAHVRRKGFSDHCRMIADVEPEMLLKAIALKGEKADIRDVMRDPDVDPKLKRALGDVLIATGNIIGMEGHRSQIRNRGHAAGWHYGNATLFVTPNLADARAVLLLQLHGKQYAVQTNLDDVEPELPSAATMKRILASDPVAQATMFHLMMQLFFTHVIGIVEPLQREYIRVGGSQSFEDGLAASTYGGCFGDVGMLTGPLETQGRGSMHPHILVTLLGHDLTHRLASLLDKAASGHVVIEMQRWSSAVKDAARQLRYDSQLQFAEQVGVESVPLPLSEKQRVACGEHYADVPICAVEPDGNEVRWVANGGEGELTLTGSYSSLRPLYQRRSEKLTMQEFRKAFVLDYRRLVIQNHFHKCTKSCFKASLKRKRTGCRFGCVHLEISDPREVGGKKVKQKFKGWPRVRVAQFQPNIVTTPNMDNAREEAACNENPHVFSPVRDHPFEGMSHPTPQVLLRCNCDVKYLGRGISEEDFVSMISTEGALM